MLASAETAKTKLERIEPVLISAGETATTNWFTLVTDHPEFARSLTTRTRANFIHDHMCPEIERGVEELPGVTPTEALGFFALNIDSEILLRPKYVGHGVPHNVATTQQKLLARQEYDESMLDALGFGPMSFLTCGYTLGDGELGRMEIRCDCKGLQSWSYDIYGGTAMSAATAFPGMEDEARPAAVKSTRKVAAEKEQGLVKEA
jgi:hypothetical protein